MFSDAEVKTPFSRCSSQDTQTDSDFALIGVLSISSISCPKGPPRALRTLHHAFSFQNTFTTCVYSD